jgi:putative membrane protein
VAGFEVHVSVLVGCVLLAAGYGLVVGPAGRRFGWVTEGAGWWRTLSWVGAVAIMFFTLNGPLHELADESLFSAHMIQHMLLMLVMPPFLLMGLPRELMRRLVRDRTVLSLARVLTNPALAFVVYNAVFIGWHFPVAYDLALKNHNVHVVQHLMFISVAVMMWWSVVAPVPELERIPDGPPLMLYVFAFGIPMTIISAFLTMSDRLIYPYYELAPRVTSLGPLEDQRLGGLLMWIPGMLIFWVAITTIWFRWTREEYQEWRREAPEFAARP